MGSTQVIGPILLQRQCDGGKGDMEPSEWAAAIADRLTNGNPSFPGCGATFQWWWGSGCVCPNCGRTWSVTIDAIKRYGIGQYNSHMDEREIEERVLRNVLMRIGRY